MKLRHCVTTAARALPLATSTVVAWGRVPPGARLSATHHFGSICYA